ncbi:MAG: type 4a pilus biogenesis protein PilO [Acidimicrobiales bacterium]
MNPETIATLRERKIVIAAATGLLVVLIWLLAVFQPVNHKLANINTNVQRAQTQQEALQTRLARLKVYSRESATFQALEARFGTAVPSTADVYDYITAISNVAGATGVQVASINPSTPVASGSIAVVPVTVAVSGTYDQTLAFIKGLYALPRLTVITQVDISGGGASTSRSTELHDQFSLDILSQSSALPAKPTGG